MAVPLPGPVVAAASDGAAVWIATAERLLAYDAAGAPRWDREAPAGVQALAASPAMLAAALEPGTVAWLDRGTGAVQARRPVGGDVTVAAGGGAVWAFAAGRGWRLEAPDALVGPTELRGLDRVAVDGDRVWWTARDDTLLRSGDRVVDLGVGAAERGAMAACAGSIWIGVAGALLRVGAWGGELGPPFPAPGGPATALDCADGLLAGGSGRTVFVLDPRVDADARPLDVELEADVGRLVVTASTVWVIPEGRPSAHVVHVRPPRPVEDSSPR